MKKCDFEQAVELNEKIKRLTPLFEVLDSDVDGKQVRIEVSDKDYVLEKTEIPVDSSLYKSILCHIEKELKEAKEDFAMLGRDDYEINCVKLRELTKSIRVFSEDYPKFCDTCPALSKCNDSDDPCYKIMEAFLRGE